MAPSVRYEVRVRVQGQLAPTWWAGMFADLVVAVEPDGTTLLIGTLSDQTAVHGLLTTIRDLGLSLLSVETVAAAEAGSATGA